MTLSHTPTRLWLSALTAFASMTQAAAHPGNAPQAKPTQPKPAQVKPAPAVAPAETPAVRAGKAWLKTNQLTNDAAFVTALRNLWPSAPGTQDQWIAAREQFRDLQYAGIKSTSADTAELWFLDPNIDGYVLATVAVKPEASGQIAGIRVQRAQGRPTGVAPPARLAEPQLIAAVRARAAQDTKLDRFSGAVLLARNGRVLLQQAYGMADRTAKKPNTIDTQFRIGSMGKMFTAVAIMQLIEAGKIDPNATVGRYLPTYANAQIATSVTISHLLSHTGGTGDIFGPEFDRSKATLRDAKDYVALYQGRAPLFSAGSQTAYSNFGFMLLGRIVELVSGMSFDDYAQRNIFAPAGMASTGYLPETTKLPRRAVAYMRSGATVKRADATLPVRGTPAGGSYSTVGDFERFVEALSAGKLIKPATLQMLLTGGVNLPDGNRAPFDFGGETPELGQFFGHSGGAPGMNGELVHFMKSGYTIVVLANRMPPPAASGIVQYTLHRLPAASAPASAPKPK